MFAWNDFISILLGYLLDFIITILVLLGMLRLISIQAVGMLCLLAVGMIILSNDQLG